MPTAIQEPLTYTECHSFGKPTLHTIRVIEYHGRRPFAVYTDHGGFDFDWCKRESALYFRDIGSGVGDDYTVHAFCAPRPPPAKIWIAPGIRLHRWESKEKPEVPVDDAMLLAMGYVRLKRPLLLKGPEGKTRNPFDVGEETEYMLEYCSICRDYLPEPDLCKHIYQPSSGDCVGSGSEPPSEESVMHALDWLAVVDEWRGWCVWRYQQSYESDAVAQVEKAIKTGTIKQIQACSWDIERAVEATCGDDCEDRWEDVEDGLGWLTTLGKDTPDANAKTLAWIAKWRRTKRKRAVAAERKRLVKEVCKLGGRDNRQEMFTALGIEGKKRAELDAVPLEKLKAVVDQFKPVEAMK